MYTYRSHSGVSVLGDYLEVPGLGFLPVNAFVIHAAQPVVVDTGLGLPDRDYLACLAEVIDPADVARIWLTHPDRDHTGGLFALLEAAARARVVTTFAGAGILDTSTGTCLSSDCFGAPLPTAELARAHDAAAADPDELRAAQLLWATVDSPWVHTADPAKFTASFAPLRDFGPSAILGTHLPPVTGDTDALFATLLDAPQANPFTGPDQAALEAMLRAFQPA
jgi:metallo-beta-lactamase superfamily protein